MKNSDNKEFFSSSISDWSIIASLVSGSGILLIQQLIQSKRADLLLLFLEPAIALAFSIVFFVPMWAKLKLQHEGELIQYRYSGKGADLLQKFRNHLLCWLILPLIIALQLASIQSISHLGLDSRALVILLLAATLILTVTRYHFDRMIKLEIGVFIATALVTAGHCIYSGTHGTREPCTYLGQALDAKLIAPPLLFFWWFSGLVDIPDMRAQKLLQIKASSLLRFKVAMPYAAMFLIQSVYLWKPLHPDQSFFIPVICMLLLNALTFINSNLHWSASLMTPFNSSKGNIAPRQNIKRINSVQIASISIAILILISGKTIQDIFSSIIFLTAGVGPIYLLRWIWYRVNAWTQLSAMIGAIAFSLAISFMFPQLHYYKQLALAGTINIGVALVIMFLTQRENENQKARAFIVQISSQNPFKDLRNWFAFAGLALFFILILFSVQILNYYYH